MYSAPAGRKELSRWRGTTIRTPAGVAGTPRAPAGARSFIAIFRGFTSLTPGYAPSALPGRTSRTRRSIDEDEFVQIKGRQTQLNESRCPRRFQRSHFGRQRFFPSFLPGLLRQLLQQRQCFFALLRGRAPRKRNSP